MKKLIKLLNEIKQATGELKQVREWIELAKKRGDCFTFDAIDNNFIENIRELLDENTIVVFTKNNERIEIYKRENNYKKTRGIK